MFFFKKNQNQKQHHRTDPGHQSMLKTQGGVYNVDGNLHLSLSFQASTQNCNIPFFTPKIAGQKRMATLKKTWERHPNPYPPQMKHELCMPDLSLQAPF